MTEIRSAIGPICGRVENEMIENNGHGHDVHPTQPPPPTACLTRKVALVIEARMNPSPGARPRSSMICGFYGHRAGSRGAQNGIYYSSATRPCDGFSGGKWCFHISYSMGKPNFSDNKSPSFAISPQQVKLKW